jgi:radical SAM superfamily enzyme YgiQ (UPF0313 family)
MKIDLTLVNVPYLSQHGGEVLKPLGLCYLASYLIEKGFKINGFDFSSSKEDPLFLVDKFKLHRYPYIGLSFYNVNAVYAFELAKAIKFRNGNTKIIAGGAHVSAVYDTILTDHPEIDIIVRDEGELTTEELLNSLNYGLDLRKIKGIVYKIDNEVIITDQRERISILDDIPAPTFDFFATNKVENYFFDHITGKEKNAVSMVTSRSCPYNCSFCAIILIGRQWRKCSSQKVLNDLLSLQEHENKKYEHIYFLDANFFVSVERTIEIAQVLNNYNNNITFSFSTRANQIIKAEKHLGILFKLGLRAVEIGIESGSNKALERFSKDITVEENFKAISLLNENDIKLYLDFIMFDAEASIEDLDKNLEFLAASNLDYYVPWDHLYSYMTPYLGTRIRTKYELLLNRKFDRDQLPDPASLFINDKVKRIFTELMSIRPMFSTLEKRVISLQDHLRYINSNQIEFHKVRLELLSLKRMPFNLMKALIAQAKNDVDISVFNAINKLNIMRYYSFNNDFKLVRTDQKVEYEVI